MAAWWLTEADVAGVLDMPSAIAAVREAFRAQAAGDVLTMPKTHVRWGGGHTLHAIGAVSTGDGLVATKTWAHTAGGAEPLLVLWDADSGAVRAVIEAFLLGQFRTAAVSGVATDLLARPKATTMAMVGSGRQALPQVAAVAAVRPLDGVRVFSPTPEHRESLARRVEAELGLPARACASVEQAVADAAIVTTATRATDPILGAGAVGSGAHVNAIGAITPERVEVGADLVHRCDIVVADDVDAARELSTELTGRERITALSELVAGRTSRPGDADLTMFKALGTGLADLAVGAVCLRAATERDLGLALQDRHPVAGRFREGAWT